MLIDMHAHTSGISRCCQAPAEEIIRTARESGIDGLVLCNHYQEAYVTDEGPAAFAEAYIEEYYYSRRIADEMNFPLFFGVEVTAKLHGGAHILIYGMPPEFVRKHPAIYAYPLEKMARLVREGGGLIVQAHPFRGGGSLLDLTQLDGVEVNCHPLYDATHCDRLLKIASDNGLLVTCGGDYHADTPYRPVCGTFFPDSAATAEDLVSHLKTACDIRLHVHELRTEDHADVFFAKQP